MTKRFSLHKGHMLPAKSYSFRRTVADCVDIGMDGIPLDSPQVGWLEFMV